MPLYINGEVAIISLAQLVAEGKEIIERENIPPSKYFDLDLWAASVAVSRYDEAHRTWLEANEDDHRRRVRNEVRENVRQLRTLIEGVARRIESKGRAKVAETDYDKTLEAAGWEIKRAVDEFRSAHPEPRAVKVSISSFLDFDDDGGRDRIISVSLSKEQCQQLYHLASTDLFEATDFLFSLYLRLPMEIRDTKVKILKREEGEGR